MAAAAGRASAAMLKQAWLKSHARAVVDRGIWKLQETSRLCLLYAGRCKSGGAPLTNHAAGQYSASA
jgi:hypothetical protein